MLVAMGDWYRKNVYARKRNLPLMNHVPRNVSYSWWTAEHSPLRRFARSPHSRPNKAPVRQSYEVYSQKFQKEDFGEEEKFDPGYFLLISPHP